MTPLGFEILTWGSQCYLMDIIEEKLVSYVWHSRESPLEIGRTKSLLNQGLSVLGAPWKLKLETLTDRHFKPKYIMAQLFFPEK